MKPYELYAYTNALGELRLFIKDPSDTYLSPGSILVASSPYRFLLTDLELSDALIEQLEYETSQIKP